MLTMTWRRLQTAPAYLRWPVKWLLFAAVFLLTLYPHPGLLVRQLSHMRNLNALPDPTEPALAAVQQRFSRYLDDHDVDQADVQAMLAAVNAFVCREIRYSWDWDVWGVADYTPTVAEVIAQGHEDCDGRAVLAAALLRGRGIPASLVADTRHMWVSTPAGETMNPLGPPVVRTDGGQTRVDWARLIDLGPPAFGISVFPLRRELIILATAWLLLLPVRPSAWPTAFSLLLFIQALLILRMAGADPIRPHHAGIHLGLLNLLGGAALLAWSRRASKRVTEPELADLFVVKEPA